MQFREKKRHYLHDLLEKHGRADTVCLPEPLAQNGNCIFNGLFHLLQAGHDFVDKMANYNMQSGFARTRTNLI